MAKKGRPADVQHRTASGQKSRAQAIVKDDGLVASQPHRRIFVELFGDAGARSQLAATALGRLRLIGMAEAATGIDKVRLKLFPERPPGQPNGIDEDEHQGALAYLSAVGRERWVRAAPKDKPSAISFMTARGIDLSAAELTDESARYYIKHFEEARAVLGAAACSLDLQRVLRQLRGKVDALDRGRNLGEVEDVLRQLRGIGSLQAPQVTAAIKRAVDHIVIDDRDPTIDMLRTARAGFRALAEWEGAARARAKASRMRHSGERPTDASVPEGGTIERGWKGRHRSLANEG